MDALKTVWMLLVCSLGVKRSTSSNFTTFHYDTTSNNGYLFTALTDATFTSNGIDLTPTALGQRVGWLQYSLPIPLLQTPSFSTFFSFQIFPNSSINSTTQGDGLAFILVNNSQGPNNASSAGGFGLFSGSVLDHAFAVEFDTFQNTNYNDTSNSHVGIDINTVVSSVVQDTSGTPLDLHSSNDSTFYSWIDYNSSSHLLQVYLGNQTAKPQTPILNHTFDLSTIFTDTMYAALGASVGSAYEHHLILSWNFTTLNGSTFEGSTSPTSNYRSNYTMQGSNSPSPKCRHCAEGIGSGVGVFIIFLVIVAVFIMMKSLRPKDDFTFAAPGRYTYKELRRATGGFSESNLLGRGAFGIVYKGILPSDKSEVAVKKLLLSSKEHEDEFRSEVEIISSIRHRNLVELRGWCHERRRQVLVYEYVPNKSLEYHLFNNDAAPILGWMERYRVAVGVAAALEYLHEGRQQCILHRDVKAANVMLDNDYTARLGDFGLARFIERDKVATMTAAGTIGYVAPELPLTGKATAKADVYSYGILALEIVCGRRVLDYSLPPQESQLLSWVWLLHESDLLMECVDTKLSKEGMGYEQHQARCLLHVGLVCCHPVAEARPSMRQVLQVLQEQMVVPLGKTRPVISYSYDLPLSMDELLSSSSGSNKTMITNSYANGASGSSLPS